VAEAKPTPATKLAESARAILLHHQPANHHLALIVGAGLVVVEAVVGVVIVKAIGVVGVAAGVIVVARNDFEDDSTLLWS